MTDWLIRGGEVVLEAGVVKADVALRGGRIAAVGSSLGRSAREFDASGLLVMPGCVDPHVHFNEPGREHWEGWETGSRGALAGGVTTVCEMPLNASPPTIDRNAFETKLRLARQKSGVDFVLWGGLVDDNLNQLESLVECGAVGFKAFMSESASDFPPAPDPVLYDGMKLLASRDCFVGVHAENNQMVGGYARRLQSEGRLDRQAYLESRPIVAELEAIQRALLLARQAGARLHIVHVSNPEGIDLIESAFEAGQPVSAETCPHFLFFDEDDFKRIGSVAKCAPPLRSRESKEGLWDRVLAERLQMISSDHSPCPAELKIKGEENIWDAWGGITGIQTMLPAVWTAGAPRGLRPEQISRLMARNPARLFGIYPKKGALAPGSDGDLVLFDPSEEWTLTRDALHTKSKLSAYLGCSFKGRVKATFLRGELVYQNGSFFESRGRWLGKPRHSPTA